jgi:hypothetical protein
MPKSGKNKGIGGRLAACPTQHKHFMHQFFSEIIVLFAEKKRTGY